MVAKKKAEAKKAHRTVQPFILGIGDLTKQNALYVVVDGTYYEMKGWCEAVDHCFQFAHALNAEYQEQCRMVWTFLQHYIYELKTAYDKIFTSAQTVASEMDSVQVGD